MTSDFILSSISDESVSFVEAVLSRRLCTSAEFLAALREVSERYSHREPVYKRFRVLRYRDLEMYVAESGQWTVGRKHLVSEASVPGLWVRAMGKDVLPAHAMPSGPLHDSHQLDRTTFQVGSRLQIQMDRIIYDPGEIYYRVRLLASRQRGEKQPRVQDVEKALAVLSSL